MAARIAGIGIGLFILAVIWVLALLLCLTLSKAQGSVSYAGFGAVALAIVVTLVLGFLPRGPDTKDEDVIIYDPYVIGRIALISLCVLFALVGFFAYFGDHLSAQVFAQPLKKMK